MSEVYAVRFAGLRLRRSQLFWQAAAYGEPDDELGLAFCSWVVRGPHGVVLVDTGPDLASARGRRLADAGSADPVEALRVLDIGPESVDIVVVSHMHYDHIGNVTRFPNARVVVQARELDFWSGPDGRAAAVPGSVQLDEVAAIGGLAAEGRLLVVDGRAAIAPGVEVDLMPGHCPGQQVVLVEGERPVLLVSDAVHFYEELEHHRPYISFTDLPGLLTGYRRARRWQDEGGTVVPGHDPDVFERFPEVARDGEVVAARIT